MGERRVNAPYGMHGGEPGERGCSYWMRKNKDGSLRKVKMKPSQTIEASRGDRLIVHTPGGGGYGAPEDVDADSGSRTSAVPKVNGRKDGKLNRE